MMKNLKDLILINFYLILNIKILLLFFHIGFKNIDEYMYLIGDAKNISVILSELNKL